jgi:hypothetical protein
VFYHFSVTVPANTLDIAPVNQVLQLTQGVVQSVHVLFPSGVKGMVKVRLFTDGHQYLPTDPDTYFWGNGEPVRADDEYYDLGEPYQLRVQASSPGTSYSHTIGIRISLLRPEDTEKISPIMGALQKFLNLIGVKT